MKKYIIQHIDFYNPNESDYIINPNKIIENFKEYYPDYVFSLTKVDENANLTLVDLCIVTETDTIDVEVESIFKTNLGDFVLIKPELL